MAILIPEKLYGIIGWPLGQSMSPLMHNAAFQELNLPAAYISWPVPLGKLGDFLGSMRLLKIFGCSVTIPHKIAVMEYLQSVSEAASLAGAVNTLFWRDDNLCGENTDVAGFLAPLENLDLDKMDALLLGAGGAAHAVAAGLRLHGCRQVRVASPGNRHQFDLATRFGFNAILWEERYKMPASFVINATPLGMHGKYSGETPYDFASAPTVANGIAYDLVYNPLRTRFLEEARANGRKTISGLEMFLGQGEAQFHLWTGHKLPESAKNLVRNALGGQ